MLVSCLSRARRGIMESVWAGNGLLSRGWLQLRKCSSISCFRAGLFTRMESRTRYFAQ